MSSDKNRTSSTLAAVAPKTKLELYSPQYYGLCMLGGAVGKKYLSDCYEFVRHVFF